MAITYTTFLTENPNSNTQRIYRGYEVSGVGVVFNVLVKINPSQGDFRSVDSEVFIPGATLADFSSMSWTLVEAKDLGLGQKRYVRTYATAGRGTLIELMRTAKYQNIEQIGSVDVILAEQGGFGAPWFEWNGTDLTQFDSPVYGPYINQGSSIVAVVSYAGVNWIRMRSATNAGSSSGNQTGIVLPISTTPPSADYVVLAEFISKVRSGVNDSVGAGVVARFTDLEHGYVFRYKNGTAVSGQGNQDIVRLNTGYSMTALIYLADPKVVANDQGIFMGIAVEGQIHRALAGEKGIAVDSTHTAVGKAGLLQSTNGLGSTVTENYFRSIRCYTLDVLRNTTP